MLVQVEPPYDEPHKAIGKLLGLPPGSIGIRSPPGASNRQTADGAGFWAMAVAAQASMTTDANRAIRLHTNFSRHPSEIDRHAAGERHVAARLDHAHVTLDSLAGPWRFPEMPQRP